MTKQALIFCVFILALGISATGCGNSHLAEIQKNAQQLLDLLHQGD